MPFLFSRRNRPYLTVHFNTEPGDAESGGGPADDAADQQSVEGGATAPVAEAAQTTEAAPAQAPATPASPEVRLMDYARSLGVQIPDHLTDETQFATSALYALANQGRYRQAEEVANRYTQYAPQFERWMAEQERQVAAARAEEPKHLLDRKPEFDRYWLSLVEQDENGNLRPAKGGSHEIVRKVNAYLDWKREWDHAVATDPMGAFSPVIERKANEILEQRLQQFQYQQQSRDIIRENAQWLFANDGQRFLTTPTGQRQLTPAGELFYGYVREASDRYNIREPAAQHEYALKMTQADALMAQQRGQAAGATPIAQQNAQAKQQFINSQANHQPNRGGAKAPPGREEISESDLGMSFRERLSAAFKAEGIDDRAFASTN